MHDKMQYDLLVHLVLFVLLLWTSSTTTAASGAETPMAKHNCATHCGDISIPYPFGIGPHKDCYFDEWFEMVCNQSSSNSPHKLYLRRAQLEVLNVYANGTLRVKNPIAFFCGEYEGQQPANLSGSPFVYSGKHNKFTAVSCGYLALVSSEKYVVGGCRSICEGTSISPEDCEIGVNCCQTSIPPHLSVINTDIEDDSRARACKDIYAFLVDQDWFRNNFMASNFSVLKDMDSVPVVLDWSLDNTSFPLFQRFIRQYGSRGYHDPTPSCKILNATSTSTRQRLVCSCPPGFEGNPYLLKPCQDIDECTDKNRCGPGAPHCMNYYGTYTCYRHRVGGKTKIKLILIGLGAGVGLLLLLIAAWWVHEVLKKRKKIKRKEFCFKRNGGLLLEQQLSSGEVNVEKIKLFKSKELEKSTDNFNTDRILGQGGQGTVYKGMLADGRIVAVKKSKIVDESQLSGFINEVVILSQINHRNVVQLLGCCLETEVPILVYEFIPNGNLSQYIHEQNEEFPLTWEVRLRIAKEIAGALSYLHASAAFPIYHRDIKSTNILLDAKYRAKVADFGTSRSVAIDQTHLTTLVHGTFGYMDPEYFQSSQFTEKSDVYSFGVVLVELLTGQKPISFRRSQEEGKSLAAYFIISMQLDRLFEILDAQVVKGGSKADIITVANLARRCLNLSGRKRPTMREVTAELEGIQMSEKTSTVEQNYEEVEYVRTESIEPWDVVSSSTGTKPGLEGGPTSSSHEVPLLPFMSR
ncbi:hypothetical protein GBA52_010983 [Prunus armeniaca]|nr:hypothetical protein GBA52_010983 [Prunus armeniaca]